MELESHGTFVLTDGTTKVCLVFALVIHLSSLDLISRLFVLFWAKSGGASGAPTANLILSFAVVTVTLRQQYSGAARATVVSVPV